MKAKYNIRNNSVGFSEGDQVWLYNPEHRRGQMQNYRMIGKTHM